LEQETAMLSSPVRYIVLGLFNSIKPDRAINQEKLFPQYLKSTVVVLLCCPINVLKGKK